MHISAGLIGIWQHEMKDCCFQILLRFSWLWRTIYITNICLKLSQNYLSFVKLLIRVFPHANHPLMWNRCQVCRSKQQSLQPCLSFISNELDDCVHTSCAELKITSPAQTRFSILAPIFHCHLRLLSFSGPRVFLFSAFFWHSLFFRERIMKLPLLSLGPVNLWGEEAHYPSPLPSCIILQSRSPRKPVRLWIMQIRKW